jgi:hypothetical protein
MQIKLSGVYIHFSSRTSKINTDLTFAGSGLGLWISKQISTQMGGRIEVDSELGHGCSKSTISSPRELWAYVHVENTSIAFRFFVRVTAAGRDLPEPPAKIAAKRTTALVSGRILIVEGMSVRP